MTNTRAAGLREAAEICKGRQTHYALNGASERAIGNCIDAILSHAAAVEQEDQRGEVPAPGKASEASGSVIPVYLNSNESSWNAAIEAAAHLAELWDSEPLSGKSIAEQIRGLYAAASAKAGYVSVPREPTEKMIQAAMEYQRKEGKAWSFTGTYQAMLTAAADGEAGKS